MVARRLRIFALFNTTRLIGSLSYAAVASQLGRDSYLSTRLLNPQLPLRTLNGPDLVLQVSEATQVLLRRTQTSFSEAWLNPRPQKSLKPGEILFFEVIATNKVLVAVIFQPRALYDLWPNLVF